MDLKNIPMARVTWLDAQDGEIGWQERATLEDSELALCQDVGWLLVDNEEKVVIMRSHVLGEETGGGCIAIPASWVNRIEILEVSLEIVPDHTPAKKDTNHP